MKEPSKSSRLNSIDMLRGLVIVLMALDHARDYFGDMRIDPHDPQTASVALYLTRFVTHFCAPTFVFLAGTSAWLYGDKIADRKQLSWFLFSRGLWLLFLDHTVLYFSFSLSFSIPWIFLVISAIGCSMILLSAFCWLPTRIVGLIGLLVVIGHNILDPIQASSFGSLGWVWNLIHERGYLRLGWMSVGLDVAYPVLPWFGVLAAGYGLGPLFKTTTQNRKKMLLLLGAALMVAFFVIRWTNVYGDPQPWSYQFEGIGNSEVVDSKPGDGFSLTRTAMSFGFCCKYPPSLCFVLMTLGPAMIFLALFEYVRESDPIGKILLTFGRVPLFFYILHFYLLSSASIVTYWIIRGRPLSAFTAVYGPASGQPIPDDYGFQGLTGVYIAWIVLLVVLYPLCAWYGKRKRAGKSRLWSYL